MTATFLANLPWYDDVSTASSLDELWQAIAGLLNKKGISPVEPALDRQRRVRSLWQSERLLLSQCCGPDLFTTEGESLAVIARPVFTDLDCTPGSYYSHIVSRENRIGESARIAVNADSSYSGNLALIEWMNRRGVGVSARIVSGSHLTSLALLRNNSADLAAIDAHLLSLFGLVLDLPVIDRSCEAFAPPFVFNRNTGIDRALLLDALADGIHQHGEKIGISGLIPCTRQDYAPTPGCSTKDKFGDKFGHPQFRSINQ